MNEKENNVKEFWSAYGEAAVGFYCLQSRITQAQGMITSKGESLPCM